MDETQSTISAYRTILNNWVFKDPENFSEGFAQARFRKKYEERDSSRDLELAYLAYSDYIDSDLALPTELHLPSGEWYRARSVLHGLVRGSVRRSPIDFPKGSSFVPTDGFNSIEQRLCRGDWTCTPDNFNEFSVLVYNHKALKRAVRRRYTRWFRGRGFRETFKESEKILWTRFGSHARPGFAIFQWKLEQITTFVQGSRFTTVPKNNKVRRPINIEPLGNLLNQRQIGNFIRGRLRSQMGIDLDTLADEHKRRISDHAYATIDLKNASDSVSIALCKFLLPAAFYKKLEDSRSPFLLGLTGNEPGCRDFDVPRKISSMGNGFTFELMTAVLTCVAKQLDETASVFGDDIIIKADQAPRLIQLLEEVGFVVNRDKSFIEGPFRESCGGNHHIDEGYVDSFDFHYPDTIVDCANILAKAYSLRQYASFSSLYRQLSRRTPKALRGGAFHSSLVDRDWESDKLPTWFITDLSELRRPKPSVRRAIINHYHVMDVRIGYEYHWVPKLGSPSRSHLKNRYHWAKYEMYLAAGRRTDDVITNAGRWAKRTLYFLDGLPTRLTREDLSDLLRENKS